MILDTIERDILIHAPPPRVWSALTEARHLGSWFGDAGVEIELEPGGRVGFTLEAEGDRSTRLRVVESGFRSLDGNAAERRRHLEANTAGWEAELDELRGYLTPLPA
jgi:uncharacterized protein YndB with AHSA1/START domain